jgi:hypothetical protein
MQVASEHSNIMRVPLPRLRKPHAWVRRQVLALRGRLEQEVLTARSAIGVAEAMAIRAICLAVQQGIVVGRVLADAGAPGTILDHATWLAYSDRLLKYAADAAKGLAKLGIDMTPEEKQDAAWRKYFDGAGPLPIDFPAANRPDSQPSDQTAFNATVGDGNGNTDSVPQSALNATPEALKGNPPASQDATTAKSRATLPATSVAVPSANGQTMGMGIDVPEVHDVGKPLPPLPADLDPRLSEPSF